VILAKFTNGIEAPRIHFPVMCRRLCSLSVVAAVHRLEIELTGWNAGLLWRSCGHSSFYRIIGNMVAFDGRAFDKWDTKYVIARSFPDHIPKPRLPVLSAAIRVVQAPQEREEHRFPILEDFVAADTYSRFNRAGFTRKNSNSADWVFV
jgi:hypothetical protein